MQSDFAAEITKLTATAESVNILAYGDSNAGKTVFAGTCPGRVFWLVGEPGYKTAARHGAQGYVRRVADTATALAALDWLEDKKRYSKFDWIVVDGLSTMQDRFRLAYAAEAFDANPTKRAHRNLPDRPDYFNTQNFLKSWVPMLVDLPTNLLITAHAYRTDKTDNGELLVFPGVQGKVTEMANAICGLMDITGYFEAHRVRSKRTQKMVTSRRLWFTSPDRDESTNDNDGVRYIAGEKYGCLGNYMVSPTVPKIMNMISEPKEETTNA